MAQSGGIRLAPHWYVGDLRQLNVTTTIKLETADTILLDVTNLSEFHLAFVDLKKDQFILTLRTDQSDALTAGVSMRLDTMPHGMQDTLPRGSGAILNTLYEPLKKLNTSYSVTRTGELAEMLDRDKNLETVKSGMQDGVLSLMALAGDNKKRSGAELDAKVDHTADSLYNSFVQVQVDELKNLLAGDAYTFPEDGSVRQRAKAHEVTVPIIETFGDLSSTLEIGIDQVTSKQLVGRVVTTYDADSVFKAMVALEAPAPKKKPRIQRAGLELKEESVYTFDRGSGWLTSSTSVLSFRSNRFRLRISSRATVTVLKP